MFIKEYKNSLLQNHYCIKCGRVWDDDGKEITDSYLKDKIREYTGTITVTCPMCKNIKEG